MSIGIYKITNPNGRIYIGQSTNIEHRWKKYKYESNRLIHKLYNSFQKYGYENHIFEIIEECPVEQLNERERYWQDYYNVLEEGLNLCLTNTSTKSGYFSEEHKKKISNSNKGKKRSQEFSQNLSNVLKGKERTEDFKQKISQLRNRKSHNDAILKAKSKPVYQFDKFGNFIKEWISGKEAARKLGLDQSNINSRCNGVGKTHGGFIWKFKTEEI